MFDKVSQNNYALKINVSHQTRTSMK